MSAHPAFPVFVFDGNDLSVFGDMRSLCTGLEGVDVEDDVYEAYDAQGHALELKASGVKRGRFGVEIGTVAVGRLSEHPNGEEFVGRLRSYLAACGVVAPQHSSTQELVDACIRRAR